LTQVHDRSPSPNAYPTPIKKGKLFSKVLI
jgi:hypothetical protein